VILVTWIPFRIHDVAPMWIALRKFVFFDFDFGLSHLGLASIFFVRTVAIVLLFWLLHAISHRKGDLDRRLASLPLPATAAICGVVGFILFLFWPTAQQPFIYFQF
jgi:hypothetical protein